MSISCPECGHESDESDFYDYENDAPDLVDILFCPECDHSWDASA